MICELFVQLLCSHSFLGLGNFSSYFQPAKYSRGPTADLQSSLSVYLCLLSFTLLHKLLVSYNPDLCFLDSARPVLCVWLYSPQWLPRHCLQVISLSDHSTHFSPPTLLSPYSCAMDFQCQKSIVICVSSRFLVV